MDEELVSLFEPATPDVDAEDRQCSTSLRIIDVAAGEIEIALPDAPRRYKLKPLGELYGSGVGADSVEPMDERYLPLFLRIEEAIVEYYRVEDTQLTDGTVSFVLDRLGMNPESEVTGQPLAQNIQVDLRLLLSLENYSRQEVRAAIRKIAKSVSRHTRLAGPRGYLTFIYSQLKS